jgi:hypothetical protein
MEKIVPMQLPEIQVATLTILGHICNFIRAKSDPNILFFLKGGMAYEILRQDKFPLDIDPAAGNDFDTILLINPQLEPAAFNALLAELRETIYRISIDILSNSTLRGSVLGALDSNHIAIANIPPEYRYDTQPFIITKDDNYWAKGTPMNLSLISIYLNIAIPEKPGFYTKIIDITIPHRHYTLLQFDYALYKMSGRVVPKIINTQSIYIADFLSILFDQSVTKTLNTTATSNKIGRRIARIRNLHNKSNKRHRNAIVNTIEPYLINNVLNGFVTNEVISRYTKGRAKAPAILPSSSSSSSSSAALITVAEAASRLASESAPEFKGPPGIKKESLNTFQEFLRKKKAESNAAKAAAAKGTT